MPDKVAPIRRTYPHGAYHPIPDKEMYHPTGPDFWSKLPQYDAPQHETERERFYRAHDIQPCMTSREAITSLLLVAGAFLTTALIAIGVWIWVTS